MKDFREATHVRFSLLDFGKERFGNCECCKHPEPGAFSIVSYAKSYDDWQDGISYSGLSDIGSLFCCPKCTLLKREEAKTLNLSDYLTKHRCS